MAHSFDARWFKDCKNAAEKEARQQRLESFLPAFEELSLLLNSLAEKPNPDYTNPAWAYEQADINGANRKLRQLKALIEPKTVERK